MKPLDGIRVIDLSMWAFCPSAGAVLAGWGADVIHVESAAAPDPMRLFAGGSLEPGRSHWLFKHYNRGKRAIALDLNDPRGQEVLLGLAKGADVFLTSFLERTRRKLGFDVDDVRAANPNIVYAKGTGAGPLGPEAHRGGYDGASWWNRGSLASSTMSVTATDTPPGMIGHGDGMSGLVLAGGIAAGLLQRALSGVAPVVDSSLLGTALWFNAPAVIGHQFPPEQRLFGEHADRAKLNWTNGTYPTADGRYINLCMMGDHQNEFEDFCAHVGRPDLVDDPRFTTSADRAVNSPILVPILDEVFGSDTYESWCKRLLTLRGVWAPVQSPAELYTDVQVLANGLVGEVEYPVDNITLPTPPIMFDQKSSTPERAPDYGEHTEALLTELGYAPDAVADLRAAGVVA